MARLNAGEPVRIVAIGSSSTTGLWMLSPSATYPEVMRRELARLRPTARIEIINSGRIGETVTGSIARFSRDVLALKPDLVIWQLGTNDVAWGGRAEGLKEQVTEGVRALKAGGADVILMDLQYAPVVLAASHHGVMQAIIAEVARQERVGLFSRFALMRRSIEAGLPAGALVSWDGLHNSTAGYDCVGRALARAVHAGGR
jgi:lysophospholipase L1-like esterase